MALHFSIQTLLVLAFICVLPFVRPFTVVIPDSGGSSALVDGPQTGFSMNKNGARTEAREQEAVYDIMRATGNDWATEIPDVCHGRWHGIECMPDEDNVYHVVSLMFGALSDDTAFPTCDPTWSYISQSITKLPYLKTLFFYRCFTHNPQPIPTFLGQLGSTLQTLVLRENGHVGPIPNQLGNLTRLRILDLHKNNLNGSIPISLGKIADLKSLDLSGNKLTDSIPGLSFPVLNVLDLNQNLLTGPIPSSLGACRSLIKINFSHNRLSGSIPDSISNLEDLILIDLSYNNLSGPFPISIQNLNSLQALILKSNPMGSMTIPNDSFIGTESLMILVLSNMNLQGPIPESVGQLPNLHVLHLDENHLNGSIPANFKNLKHISELRLNNNQLTGSLPFEREMVWRMKSKLRLYNNSGLCYNAGSGFEDGLDSSIDSGIGLCDNGKSGSGRSVQHLATVDEDVPGTIDRSISAVDKGLSFVRLLQLTAVALMNLFLL